MARIARRRLLRAVGSGGIGAAVLTIVGACGGSGGPRRTILVDERHKYIWFSQTGRELLFDLEADPLETHDLSPSAIWGPGAGGWCRRCAIVSRASPTAGA